MKIAYLMNSYPMTSTTFIRREVEALEAIGVEVLRFAIRVWPHPLVDARDRAEQTRTHYVLTSNHARLFMAGLIGLLSNAPGMLRAAVRAVRISRHMGWEVVRPAAYLLQAAYFARETRRLGVDHVHVHFVSNAASVAMLARLIGGPTYSFTVHGPDELLDLKSLSLKDKVREASFVIAISDYCRARLVEECAREDAAKISVARCGLALEEFDAPSDAPEESRTFVCIGRLCRQKGQHLIPEAVARLRKEFDGVKVVLLGDGETRSAVEAAIEAHGVEGQVVLKGWTSNGEALALLQASRALLLPSFAEGLPVVIMEALCLRRPVVSTTIAGIPELVDDTCGWLVAPGDLDALTDAMREALRADRTRLAAMGAVGRARVHAMHDRRELAQTLHGLFVQALGACARPEVAHTTVRNVGVRSAR